VLLLLSGEVWALGLGEVRLDSALNEPLRAQIELLGATPDEVQDLEVTLASPETFDRYGLERPYYLQDITFEVVRSGRADGNYILMRSAVPMTEPFLTVLVEATWSNGRLLREYTVLLDPPTFAPRAEAPRQPEVTAPERAAPADSGQIERPAPPPATEPAVAPRATAPAPEPVEPLTETPTMTEAPEPEVAPEAEPADDRPFDAAAGEDYSVVRGDTLWGIASRIQPDSRLTMNQTMLAIFEANPEAFGGNINVLRAGSRLRIPSADEIFRIDRTEAFNEARRQNDEWQGGAAVTPAPEPTPVPAEEPESRPSLTLVPPDEEPVEQDAGVSEVPADEPVSREQEILDRIAEIEAADVPVQESLIEIRDNELANLRRELAEIRGEVYEPPADAADEPVVEDEEAVAEDDADTLIPDDEVVEPETETPAADVTPERPEVTTRVAEPEPSLIDTILGWLRNVWVLLGAALILVIAILAWFMRRSGGDEGDAWSRRVEPADVPDETMAATESLRAPDRDDESIVVVEQTGGFRKRMEATVETRRPTPVVEDTAKFGSLEDTFSSETAVNLDQSDPVAEADFHMAYGLYDQAADLINGALRAEPERQDLLTKLCEIYFVWGNRDAFVDAAQRLKTASRRTPDDWDKIVIMGQQIAPDEEMFTGVMGATKAVDLAFEEEDHSTTGALDMDFGVGDADDGGEVIDLGGGGAEDEGIDFVFDDDVATAKSAALKSSTVEMPTIEDPFGDLDDTSERRSPAAKSGKGAGAPGRSTDATTEIDLDELGLDLDGLAETELASLADDDATELASLDDLDQTGTNEQLDDRADTGRNPQVGTDDTNLMAALEIGDDEFSSTRTGMRLAPDETGVHPARSVAEETDGDIDPDLLAATGRTQVLPDDYAVQTFGEEDEPVTLRDNDKTMLASSLSSDDFDFAKTEALPPGTYPGDDEVTGELPAIGSTDVDLDLDDLTEALKRSEKGDTVEQPRDDKTVEHRRPVMGDDTAETSSFAPEDISNDLEDARTMTEVGTKLDLARAYVDMGDPAGARSILEEVLDEGDSSQRQQAQKLLDSLPG
jgi:pilus assembly protein FimV